MDETDEFTKWWLTLDRRLFTGESKGSKARAQNEWIKLAPDQELSEKILWHTRERMREDRKIKSAGAFANPWPHAERLLRYRFWEDDLRSSEELNAKIQENQCHCGGPHDWTSPKGTRVCWQCYSKTHADIWKTHRSAAGKRLLMETGNYNKALSWARTRLNQKRVHKKTHGE